MAGNKSTGTHKVARRDKEPQKPLLGKRILYVGLAPGVHTKCPVCGKSQGKGMVSLYKETYYCSESCVKSIARI